MITKEIQEFVDITTSNNSQIKFSDHAKQIMFNLYSNLERTDDIIQIRGPYESYAEKLEEAGYRANYDLKDWLSSFNIIFSDDTDDNVYLENRGTRRLYIAKEFVDTDTLVAEIAGKNITDIVFLDLTDDNDRYRNITTQFKNHAILRNVFIWYEMSLSDSETRYDKMLRDMKLLVGEENIVDITSRLNQIVDNGAGIYKTVKDLIDYGEELFNSGVSAVSFKVHSLYSSIEGYEYVVYRAATFLVYLHERYNILSVTDIIEPYMGAYRSFARYDYLLAEDILTNNVFVSPIMLYADSMTLRYVMLRDAQRQFDYYYITEKEFEKFCSNPESVSMASVTYRTRKRVSLQSDEVEDDDVDTRRVNHVLREMLGASSTIQRDLMIDDFEIIPLFEYFTSDDDLNSFIKGINTYIVKASIPVKRYLTVRDVLVIKTNKFGSEQIEIGFMSSGRINDNPKETYNNRCRDTFYLSKIHPNNTKMLDQAVEEVSSKYIDMFMNCNLVYDLKSSSLVPSNFRKLICDDEVGAYVIGAWDKGGGQIISVYTKYLVYALTKGVSIVDTNDIIADIYQHEEEKEFLSAIYTGVYTATEIAPELALQFGINNIINAGVLDLYGEISEEFLTTKITNTSVAKKFNVTDKLFGRISPN